MKLPKLLPATLLLCVGFPVSLAQSQNRLPPNCAATQRIRGQFPGGPFTFLPGERYRGGPLVKFEIGEDGSVTNVRIGRSSGITDIDKETLRALAAWKYNTRSGCPPVDIEMSVLIHCQ